MKCILVVDRPGYEQFDSRVQTLAKKYYSDIKIVHTTYETPKIRKMRNLPYIGNMLLHILRWKLSFGYAKQIYSESQDAVIISLNPLVGTLIALFRKTWKRLYVCGFLFEKKKNKQYYWLRKKLVKILLSKVDGAIVYGSKEVAYYERELSLKHKFTFVPYGIEYLNQKEYGSRVPIKYLFSGGGSNRDYDSLIQGYRLYSSLTGSDTQPLVIATQPWRFANIKLPSNVHVLSDVVNETFGSVLKHCSLLVLSLKDTEISAGHMVMLQAMAEKVPILVNDIPAIRDYADSRMVTFYRSGDVQNLCDTLIESQGSDGLQKKVLVAYRNYCDNYTFLPFIERLIQVSLKDC